MRRVIFPFILAAACVLAFLLMGQAPSPHGAMDLYSKGAVGAAATMEDGTSCAADVGLAFAGDDDTGLYLVDVGTAPGHAIGLCVDGTASGLISIGASPTTSSYGNTFVGWQAGQSVDLSGTAGTGDNGAYHNTALGGESLAHLTSGIKNTCVGNRSCYANTSGIQSTCVGQGACYWATTNNNTAIGYHAGLNFPTGTNTAVGSFALEGGISNGSTGTHNVAIGPFAAQAITDGNFNTALGSWTGTALTSGDSNTLLGVTAADLMTSGNDNTVVGSQAARHLTSHSNNVIVGAFAADDVVDSNNVFVGAHSVGSGTSTTNGVVLGYSAGATLTTGDQVTLVGASADVTAANRTNCTALGYGATCAADNSVKLGNASVTTISTTGAWKGPAGTAAAPAITTSGDDDTGNYAPAPNTWGVSAGGTLAAYWDATYALVARHLVPDADETRDLGVNGYSWDQLRVRQVTRGNPGGGDELELADSVVMREQTTSAAPDYFQLPRHISSDVTTNRPACSSSAHAGRLLYIDDDTDAVPAGVCVCGANAVNAYGWRSINNFGVNCHL